MKPLWTDSTIEMVEKILKPDMKVLEYGAGFSTPWIAKRVHHLWSCENDYAWYNQVMGMLHEQKIENVEVACIDICSPTYVQNIIDFENDFFDFCLVDCAFRRVEVFEQALLKVRKGGIIMLDDSQNLSWKGIFFVKGVKILEESLPDESGKKATFFERL